MKNTVKALSILFISSMSLLAMENLDDFKPEPLEPGGSPKSRSIALYTSQLIDERVVSSKDKLEKSKAKLAISENELFLLSEDPLSFSKNKEAFFIVLLDIQLLGNEVKHWEKVVRESKEDSKNSWQEYYAFFRTLK